jgi:hypothetical protein
MRGKDREPSDGDQEKHPRLDIDHPELQGCIGQESDSENQGMPDNVFDIPQAVIVSAEDVIVKERRLAGLEVPAHLGNHGKISGEVVVGQEVAGTPEFENGKDQDAEA